jgi:hypothetical protein
MSSPFRRALVLTVISALLVGVPIASPADPPMTKTLPRGVVPFEMLVTNHMVVRAKINGKGPFDLIFDLGAPVTLLSNKAGVESGTVEPGAPRSFLFAMRGESEVKTLQLGELTAKNLPVIVLDHPLIKAMGQILGRPLDGIVGYTFFARYRTTIDYQARRMTFEPVNAPVRNLMKDLPERLAAPRVARHRVLEPGGLWGLRVADPDGGVDSPGVSVAAVLPESPAAAAGLKPGDVLTTLDGRWTANVGDTYSAAAHVPPGEPVLVVVLRDGKELTLTVRPKDGF